MVRGFCYLGDRVNASGGCEAAVTARARIGWVKFRECGELLISERFSLKVKGMVYRSYVRVAMLYGSETCCLRENEIASFRRTERAMVTAMCAAKRMEKKDRGPDGNVGIEGNSGSDGKGKWSKMVRACVEEG